MQIKEEPLYNSFEKTTGDEPVDESNLICHPLEIKGNPDRKVVGGCHKFDELASSAYKKEINNRLKLARNLVGEIIDQMESDYNWKTIHNKTGQAITQLKHVTKLLARYHLEICILKKQRETRTPFVDQDIEEIIKTYRYLN